MVRAETPEHVAEVRALFLEYASSLGFSLCFQSFEQELADLPGDYAPPDGRLLLALEPEFPQEFGEQQGPLRLPAVSPSTSWSRESAK